MAGKRKNPQLRFDGTYFVANIYKPDGKRNTRGVYRNMDRRLNHLLFSVANARSDVGLIPFRGSWQCFLDGGEKC